MAVTIDLTCEVCKKNKAEGVYASRCGPISFAYCEECGSKGAEPYSALLTYLVMAIDNSVDIQPEREMISERFQHIIDASLEVAGKTREEFYADFDKRIKKFNEEMERWYLEQAEETKNNVSKYDLDPDDFTVVPLDVYADRMNDRQHIHEGKRLYAVPNDIADKVVSVYIDFTHTGITFYDKEDNELLKTVGIGYDDLTTPTAFAIQDLIPTEYDFVEPDEQ